MKGHCRATWTGLWVIALVLVFAEVFPACAERVQDLPAHPTDYVSDFAHVLSPEAIERKGSDRGVLILLAIHDHHRRIEVGYGLEGILNDAKLGDIGRAMVPDLRANDFDGAVLRAVGEIAQDI